MPDDEIEYLDIDDIMVPGQETEESQPSTFDLEGLLEDEPSEPQVVEQQVLEPQFPMDEVSEEVNEQVIVEDILPEDTMEPVSEVIETMPSVNSQETNDRIRSASNQLENIVQSVVQDDTNSLAATEIDIMEAKKFLSMHKLSRAKKSVHKAEQALVTLEEDVLYLRRSIAMLHRLLKEKKVEKDEVENILLKLRNATSAA